MRKRRTKRRARKPGYGAGESAHVVGMVHELEEHHDVGPRLTGGDVDADWARAESSGEEAIGGSVSTPDQDMVDELAGALGVEQESDAEVRTSDEILRERDRQRWELEAEDAEKRQPRRRRAG